MIMLDMTKRTEITTERFSKKLKGLRLQVSLLSHLFI